MGIGTVVIAAALLLVGAFIALRIWIARSFPQQKGPLKAGSWTIGILNPRVQRHADPPGALTVLTQRYGTLYVRDLPGADLQTAAAEVSKFSHPRPPEQESGYAPNGQPFVVTHCEAEGSFCGLLVGATGALVIGRLATKEALSVDEFKRLLFSASDTPPKPLTGFTPLHPSSEFEADLTGWLPQPSEPDAPAHYAVAEDPEAALQVSQQQLAPGQTVDGEHVLKGLFSSAQELKVTRRAVNGLDVVEANGRANGLQLQAWFVNGIEGTLLLTWIHAPSDSLAQQGRRVMLSLRSAAANPDPEIMAEAARLTAEKLPAHVTERSGRFLLTSAGPAKLGWNLKRVLAAKARGEDWRALLEKEAAEHVIKVTVLGAVTAPIPSAKVH